VRLTVYNTIGQKITTLIDQQLKAGRHTVNFNANNLSSGGDIYRLEGDNFARSRKMLLMK
jgi:hypothetical protein